VFELGQCHFLHHQNDRRPFFMRKHSADFLLSKDRVTRWFCDKIAQNEAQGHFLSKVMGIFSLKIN
jgi:hypothetical protein